jgi:predicted nucleic acid-binding protein
LLFDTCVYIDAAAHRLPIEVANLVRSRVSYHSMVCAAELTYALGVLDPKDPRTKQQGKVLAEILDRIAATGRTIPPHETDWAAAGVMAGILSRSQSYATDQKRKALADCLVFLSALRLGLTLLTANLAEFDLLQQILPEARVAFYRIA